MPIPRATNLEALADYTNRELIEYVVTEPAEFKIGQQQFLKKVFKTAHSDDFETATTALIPPLLRSIDLLAISGGVEKMSVETRTRIGLFLASAKIPLLDDRTIARRSDDPAVRFAEKTLKERAALIIHVWGYAQGVEPAARQKIQTRRRAIGMEVLRLVNAKAA